MTNEQIVQRMAPLLALIRKAETGKTDAAAYNVVYGGIPKRLRPERLSKSTVSDVRAWQATMRAAGMDSTAAGAYQIIYKTLLGLAPREGAPKMFDAAGQDWFAAELLKDAGVNEFLAGLKSAHWFAQNVAKIWASFPVTLPTDGKKIGASYYAGDGLNKALVSVDEVIAALAECRSPLPNAPAPKPGFLAALLAAFVSLFARKK